MLLDRNATRSFNSFLTEAQKNLLELEKVFKGVAFDPAKFAGLTGLAVKIDSRALYKEISEAFKMYIPGQSELLKLHINSLELSNSINDAIGKIVIPKGITIPVDFTDLDQKIVKTITDVFDRETFQINVKVRRTELTNDIDDYFRTGYDPDHRVRMKVHVDRNELKSNLKEFFDGYSPKLNFTKIKMDVPDIEDFTAIVKLTVDQKDLIKQITGLNFPIKLTADQKDLIKQISDLNIAVKLTANQNDLIKQITDLNISVKLTADQKDLMKQVSDLNFPIKLTTDQKDLIKQISDLNFPIKLNVDQKDLMKQVSDLKTVLTLNIARDHLRKDIDDFFRSWDPAHRVTLKVKPNTDFLTGELNSFFKNYEATVNVVVGAKPQQQNATGSQYSQEATGIEAVRKELVTMNITLAEKLQEIIDKPTIDLTNLF